jgi:N-methylhydantoinase A
MEPCQLEAESAAMTERRPRFRAGVDTGGTFTDVVLYDVDTGDARAWKLPSTPGDPSEAIFGGLEAIADRLGASLTDVMELRHGTTVGTNALIQEKIAKTGLVTTKGFRDVIEIRRQQRPDTYDLSVPKPSPIASREMRYEVTERTTANGDVQQATDLEELDAVISCLREDKVEAVAICYLHSYANPANEKATHERLVGALPNVFVCSSSALAPEFREYPRMATTLVNAALGPVLEKYLVNLNTRAMRAGMPPRVWVMHSNGGVMSSASAAKAPARTISSGPSAGVVAASAISGRLGLQNAVTFDMGGTSTDVCLIVDGQALMVSEKVVEGNPIRLPTYDVQSVGGGGGSLARVDEGGFLRVGPESAGADPGPACYLRGGSLPTVTDANVVLGRLSSDRVLGGTMPIDADAAYRAIEGLGEARGLDTTEAAAAVITVVNSEMVRAVRLQTIERGFDPREFALVAFGGAGPLHAVEVAQEVGFRRVVIPSAPGLLCALGLLVADLRADFGRTRPVLVESEDALETVSVVFADLEREARAWLRDESPTAGTGNVARSVDMRFEGQSYEINVPVQTGETGVDWVTQTSEYFRGIYERRYGQRLRLPTEIVTFRVQATVRTGEQDLTEIRGLAPETEDPREQPRAASRRVYFAGAGWVDTKLISRDSLKSGDAIQGPAIIYQTDTTTLVPPGIEGVVVEGRHLVIAID